MASLSNQSTYSSLEPHASSQKKPLFVQFYSASAKFRTQHRHHPEGRKKTKSNQRPLSSCKNQDQRARKRAPARRPPRRQMATMQSWRKAYGAIKDTTTVSLANLNSDFKVRRRSRNPLCRNFFLFVCVPQSLVKFIRTLASWCGGTGLCCSWALGSVGSDCCPLALCRIWMSRSWRRLTTWSARPRSATYGVRRFIPIPCIPAY
jgi:hypothetical protein